MISILFDFLCNIGLGSNVKEKNYFLLEVYFLMILKLVKCFGFLK